MSKTSVVLLLASSTILEVFHFRAPAMLPQSGSTIQHGVIVDEVRADSAGQNAGLEAGDVILSWSRSITQGEIDSPFDWMGLEIEQIPRGYVTIRGLRGSHDKTWALSNSLSGLTIRPVLRPTLLTLWQRCRDLAKANKFTRAAPVCRELIDRIGVTDPVWLGPWCQYQLARLLMDARQFEEADAVFQSAIEHTRIAVPTAPVHLLQDWGKTFEGRGDWGRAEACYRRSLEEAQRFASPSLMEAASLNSLGNVEYHRRDLPKAENYYQQGLTIRQRLASDSLDVAASTTNLGNVAEDRGDVVQAEKYYTQALAIYEKLLSGRLEVAMALTNLGNIAEEQGDLDRAEGYLLSALAIDQKLAPGRLDLADTLNILGILARDRGDLARAEEYYQRALTIYEKLAPGGLEVAIGFNNMGSGARDRGDLDRAEAYLRQALRIYERLAPETLDMAKVLNNLGDIADLRGDPAQGNQYLQRALTIKEKLAPSSLDVAATLGNLGNLAEHRGNLGMARNYYLKALAIKENLAPHSLNVADTLNSLGNLGYKRGDLGQAQDYYQQALAIRERLAPGSLDEATTSHALGLLLRRRNEVEVAASHFARAVNALEQQTARLGGTEEIRSSFQARYASWYLDFEDALLGQRQFQQAYLVSERYRARSFLQILAERDLVFASDLSPDLQRSRKRNAVEYDRVQSRIAELDPAKDQNRIDELLVRLRELSAEREQIGEHIKKTSPRFASLVYPQPLDLVGTRQILDPGTTVLSYSVGDEHTVLFVVQSAGTEPGLSVFTLPINEKELQARIQEFRHLIEQRPEGKNRELAVSSRRLYDVLLKPAEPLITDSGRLLIIPDGPLQVLPFAALLRNEKQYLVEWKPLHTVVSATVYCELRKMRPSVESKTVDLIAFGDPVMPIGKTIVDRSENADLRFASERGFTFGRLPFSRQEVQGIAALYPERSLSYLGADATEEHAKGMDKNVRYIHFATHGLLDERFPLNSAIVLTIPEKLEKGKENGLLQAWEIFEQVRLDADLVTLSACNTGLGREITGEGLIGLTRAFEYAGARSVVASLWSIDDFRTMQLMQHFYQELNMGKSKDEALRQAQMGLIHTQMASSPYYWAAFTLTGNWR